MVYGKFVSLSYHTQEQHPASKKVLCRLFPKLLTITTLHCNALMRKFYSSLGFLVCLFMNTISHKVTNLNEIFKTSWQLIS